MPPKKKGRGGGQSVSTPTAATPARYDDPMDIDTPQAVETPTTATAAHPAPANLASRWTSEQKAGLFSAVIQWKPSGELSVPKAALLLSKAVN